jgi:hypothetical protein
MEVVKRMIVYLSDSDIKETTVINENRIDFSWNNFKGLTQEMVNKAWFIEYRGEFGHQVIKNKCITEAGGGYLIKDYR